MSHNADSGAAPPHPDRSGGRVVVFGEVLFDHFEDGGTVLGGAPFNVVWHLCGFGRDPLLLSAVGDDDAGRKAVDEMEGWGLSTEGVLVDPDHPTGFVRVFTQDGSPAFEIEPDQAWDHIHAEHVAESSRDDGVALIYHGTLALRDEESRTALHRLRDEVDAPVFVDVNLRAPWWTPERVHEALARARWAKVNAEELRELAGGEADDDALVAIAREFRARHDLHRLVVTRGAEGALLIDDTDRDVHVEAPHVADLADTVGAGDAFCAVLCLGIVQGWSDEVMLRRAVDFAGDVCRFQGATLTDISIYDTHLRHWSEPPPHVGPEGAGLSILSLSVHGLVRAREIELGRDADTGGQVSYVVDQAKALAKHPGVDEVELVTRLVSDKKVDDGYAAPRERIASGATIVRLPFGPKRYLRKETLWPYLDTLLDELVRYLRGRGRLPDAIHGHYADAGYVGAQLSKLLGVPFVFTGHSLGRIKRQRLLDDGLDAESIEDRYRITRRIEAEEQALEAADLVITSTRHEVESQYEGYDHYLPGRMEVIPPGVDLTRFSPPSRFWSRPPIQNEIERFLNDPEKPMILALARADERKNFRGLIHAYSETPGLRERANLVLVAGNRDDIREMDAAPRRVLSEILHLVDRFDLYGSVAYPKHHASEDVPDLYRLAAQTGGIFVNPALTEPFGLTLIEAAASGLPVVATDDGGPRDIVGTLEHGMVVDALDTEALGRTMLDALSDRRRWARWTKNAVSRVHESFSWRSHASRYVAAVRDVISGQRPALVPRPATRLPGVDRVLITDVDDTLTGDDEALSTLLDRLHSTSGRVGFGIATGRRLEEALELLDGLGLWVPDVLITASGTELHYGSRLTRDRSWERRIEHRWQPDAVREVLAGVEGLSPARAESSTRYRLRYEVTPGTPSVEEIRRRLRQAGLMATVILDHGSRLEVLPGRASPGMAIRFLCFKWNLPPDRLLVAGDSGNDADMLSGDTLGVVVGNHTEELESLREHPRVYFADGRHARGVIEGIDHYDFFGTLSTQSKDPG